MLLRDNYEQTFYAMLLATAAHNHENTFRQIKNN